jgi:diguanylate cyclase (GGDEF)-like protein/PAS domain S-box-containing protein
MTRDAILLVDDEPQVLVALDDTLSEHFTVVTARSAKQALDVARERRDIAVVMTDQRMPETTGDQLVAMLAAFSDATRILLTGFADLAAVIHAVNSGRIFAYVTKPWNPDDLLHRVHKAAEHFHMVKELAHERQMLHDLMDSVPDGIFFKDLDLRFLRVNKAHAGIVNQGRTSEDLVGKRLSDMLPGEAEALHMEAEERRVLAGVPALDVVRAERIHGSLRWISESKAAIRNANGEPIGLVGIARDITERRRQQERIARLTRIQSVTSGINSVIVRTRDRVELLAESCRIAVQVGGLGLALALRVDSVAERVDVLAVHAVDENSARAVRQLLQTPGKAGETLARLALGSKAAIVEDPSRLGFPGCDENAALALFPLRTVVDSPTAICLLSRPGQSFDEEELELLNEVTENIAFGLEHISKTLRLDFLAYHDELTTLPKRALFLERLNQRIANRKGPDDRAAVLVIDIGRFRQINETLGRIAGDQLLVQIAQRIAARLPDRDILARFDSNTFAVLSSWLDTEAELAQLVEDEILPSLRECFMVSGVELRISAKVGIALFPADGATAEAVIAHAEVALKNAKAGAAKHLFYAPSMHELVAERLTLETRLRRAVESESFELYYQPKVELKTGLTVGLEALLRWRDPVLGSVSPVQFIPVLEEIGLIHEVGRWALQRASAQYGSWIAAGFKAPRIAVNVSALQLAAADLEQTLRDCPHAREGIDIEITESVFVKDLAGSVAKLEAARRFGLRVAIDDFGTGYSSLGYLSRLPIDALKIDRSFIVGMAIDPQETTIVTTIISLAHSMDLEVIAEGVETIEQAHLLRLLKCDQIQGYLVSKPQPADEIQALLGKRFVFSALASA